MNYAALTRSAPPVDMRSAIHLEWVATAANDDVAGIEVIELDVVEIELRAGTVITWGPM